MFSSLSADTESCWEFWVFRLLCFMKASTSILVQAGNRLLEFKEVVFLSKQPVPLVPLGNKDSHPPPPPPPLNFLWLPDLTFYLLLVCFFVTRLIMHFQINSGTSLIVKVLPSHVSAAIYHLGPHTSWLPLWIWPRNTTSGALPLRVRVFDTRDYNIGIRNNE